MHDDLSSPAQMSDPRETVPSMDLSSTLATPSDPTDFDYGTDGEADGVVVARAFADLDRLTLAAERATLARQVAEAALQKAKDAEKKLLEREIPELMALMRQEKCTTSSGVEVTVKRDIKASLPGMERIAHRMNAFAWLIEHGHGGVIKNVVTVDLDRGEDTRADELVMELRAKGFDPQAKKDVHAGTLGKLVRELMAEGKIIPKENFNIFDMRVASLKRKE